MTLTISTTRAEELARWIDANLEATVYRVGEQVVDLPSGTRRIDESGPADTIDITFGGDDLILFDLRWQGEFNEVTADFWVDGRSGYVTWGQIVASTITTNKMIMPPGRGRR
jgi:hypothetical protein